MKLLKYLIIYRTTKDPIMAAKIYQMIYHPEIVQLSSVVEPKITYSEQKITNGIKPTHKKNELLYSLEYLKNKKIKTKQDLESIYTIEMVLKTM